tara:strand:+ start:1424 stop:2107 length:684 start_codon:yes stop_codon:yes gene_type:complete
MLIDNFFGMFLPFLGAILGIFLGKILPLKKNLGMKLILSFSGAFLLAITVFELLPEIYSGSKKSLSIFVMCGILFQIILEFFSKGAEHGHHHTETDENFPLGVWLSLCLHALVEGMPIGTQEELNFGIFVHKIPIGMILFFILDKTNISVNTKWFALIGFSLMSPLGALMMESLKFLDFYRNEITGLVVGMLLHIATTILFESTENHSFNIRKLSIIILAVFMAYLL